MDPYLAERARVVSILRPQQKRLDVTAVAAATRVDLVMTIPRWKMHGSFWIKKWQSLWGLEPLLRGASLNPDNPYLMLIRSEMSEVETLLTVAHELGHWFDQWLYNYAGFRFAGPADEARCEQFGRELVVPSAWLKDVDDLELSRLQEILCVNDRTMLLQLMECGRLQEVVFWQNCVLCRRCSWNTEELEHPLDHCICLQYRSGHVPASDFTVTTFWKQSIDAPATQLDLFALNPTS